MYRLARSIATSSYLQRRALSLVNLHELSCEISIANNHEPLAQSVEQRALLPPNLLRVTPKHVTSLDILVDAGVILMNYHVKLVSLTIMSH
ncbi:hypothetical protein [Ornithinibacillus bavariensis]|uniref:hypothetical protein n=1 Tax=Ornithinibacillus bavariensis TaxID=545502 RepID=UPI001BB41D9C|nr:hypothetical protein [Ornithinibacillus bavariensis]